MIPSVGETYVVSNRELFVDYSDDPNDRFGSLLENYMKGRPTPATHPYTFDPYLLWRLPDPKVQPEHTAYSDRMYSWDCKRYETAAGENGLGDHTAREFFSAYYPDYTLVRIVCYCNHSNGQVLYRFDYNVPEDTCSS